MTEQTVTIRLTADNRGLVGAVQVSERELRELSAASRAGGQATEAAGRQAAAAFQRAGQAATLAAAQTERATLTATRGLGRFGAVAQQAGFQIGDVATQIALGGNAMLALSVQGSQLISMFGGPWGAAIGAGVAIVGALAAAFFNVADGANTATAAIDENRTALEQAEALMKRINDLGKSQFEVIRERRAALLAGAQGDISALRDQIAEKEAEIAEMRTSSINRITGAGIGRVKSELDALHQQLAAEEANLAALRRTFAGSEAKLRAAEADDAALLGDRAVAVAETAAAARRRAIMRVHEDAMNAARVEQDAIDDAATARQAELERGYRETFRELGQQAAGFADASARSVDRAFDGMGDAIARFATTGKLSFADLTQSILSDLIRIQVRQALVFGLSQTGLGPLLGLGPPAPAGFAGIGAAPYHAGGVVGPGRPERTMPDFLFRDAPRLHAGGWLRPGERAAILLDDEEVLTPGDPRHVANGGRGGTIVNIIDRRGADAPQAQVSRGTGPGGVERIDVLILSRLDKLASEGRLDRTLRQNYGVTRAPVQRS